MKTKKTKKDSWCFLTRKPAQALLGIALIPALENDEIIKGFIKCRTKGGMIVDVFGIEAFLPGSQIDVKPIRDYDVFVGKTMEFKVVKINQEFKNVVVSQQSAYRSRTGTTEKRYYRQTRKRRRYWKVLSRTLPPYGVFIDLGGVDGLIHITDPLLGTRKPPRRSWFRWIKNSTW